MLPLLAAERTLRALVLVGVGIVLATHLHTDWGEFVRRAAGDAGLDPSSTVLGKLIASLSGVGGENAERDAAVAIGYGLLEAVEAYGLLRRRTWGEYLTVLSTALLFIPEVAEIAHRPTAFKFVALALNILIVVYLVIRLVRRRRHG